jgi:hypothetical protein
MTHYTAQDNNQGLVRGQQSNQSNSDRVRIILALSIILQIASFRKGSTPQKNKDKGIMLL